MPFDITEFRGSMADSGEPQKSALFEVVISPPAGILTAIGPIQDLFNNLRFRCNQVNIPGKNVNAFDYQNTATPNLKIAYDSIFDEIQMNVIVTEQGLERMILGAWNNYVNPTQTYQLEVRYYDNYVGSMQILTYDRLGNVTQTVDVQGCYPRIIGSTEYAWDHVNQSASFRVAWSYELMTVTNGTQQAGDIDDQQLDEVSATQMLNGNGTPPSSSPNTATNATPATPATPNTPITIPTN